MLENAIEYVKQIFANDCSGHDYYHTMRVYRLAVQIAKAGECRCAVGSIITRRNDAKLSPKAYAQYE